MSGKDPIVGINVDEAVAIGAALETEMFNQAEERYLVLEVNLKE